MKRILLILALAPSLVLAAGWGLTRSYGSFPTEAACRAAAASQPAGTYLCSNVLQSSVTVGTTPPPPVNPFPSGETRTVQCVAPTVGSWTQMRTYTLTGTSWIAGAWSPATAPAGACTTPSTGSPLKASLAASRVTGIAPLAVLFDATGTTGAAGVDTFRQVTYSFDFGDDRSQTWAVSGKPKNSETGGPLAAHVFDLPGTYMVRLSATDGAGNTSTSTVAITVSDPVAVYAGTKTVCVGSDFTACPADAARQAAIPTGTQWSGKRWLLQAGGSFGAISILDGNSGVQVGSYGSGAKPVVASVGVGNWRPSTANFASDVTVMDLSVKNSMQQTVGQRVLFYRNDVRTTGAGLSMTFGQLYFWYAETGRIVPASAFYNAREIFFVENNAINPNNSDASYGVWGDGSRVALLGNRYGNQTMHSVRISACNKCVIDHNEIQGRSSDAIRLALKLHGMGLNPYADGLINDTSGVGGWASNQIVIASNVLGNAADNNDWTIAVAPQNDVYVEGVENVIIENNRFVRGSKTSADIAIGGRKITYRNNTPAALMVGPVNGALPAEWTGPNYNQ